MESRHGDQQALGRATQIIAEKGHLYRVGQRYASLKVFSRNVMEMNLLERMFGGKYYVHGVGFLWALSRKAQVSEIIASVKEATGTEITLSERKPKNETVSDSSSN